MTSFIAQLDYAIILIQKIVMDHASLQVGNVMVWRIALMGVMSPQNIAVTFFLTIYCIFLLFITYYLFQITLQLDPKVMKTHCQLPRVSGRKRHVMNKNVLNI